MKIDFTKYEISYDLYQKSSVHCWEDVTSEPGYVAGDESALWTALQSFCRDHDDVIKDYGWDSDRGFWFETDAEICQWAEDEMKDEL